MSGNSEQPGKPGTPPAKPVKVVRPAPAAPPASAPAPAQAPVAKAVAPQATPPAPAAAAKKAPAKKAPAKKAPDAPAKAAPAKAAPAAQAKPAAAEPAPAKAAPSAPAPPAPAPAAPATARQTAPAQPAADDTAVRPGFGSKIKSGLAKAATFTASEKAETNTSYASVSGGDDRPASSAGRSPRRARLRLSRIDPWSVAKVSFLLSVALGIVTFVAVLITWSVLGAAGVWDSVNSVVASVASTSDGTSSFNIEDYVGTGRILGLTLIVSVVNVVLLTAMATLAAYLYNMAAALLGGVEVTLAEGND